MKTSRLIQRLLVVLVASCMGLSPGAAERAEVSLASYLKAFAQENQIEIQGIEIVGRDTFTPPLKSKSADKTLQRALSRFNTIEYYGEQGVTRVVILSRKGSSVGALPEDGVPSEPPADTGSQPQ